MQRRAISRGLHRRFQFFCKDNNTNNHDNNHSSHETIYQPPSTLFVPFVVKRAGAQAQHTYARTTKIAFILYRSFFGRWNHGDE